MKAVIVSQGPSAARYRHQDGKGAVRIGVNAIAARHACDWWVSGDAGPLRTIQPLGEPRIFTTPRAWRELGRPTADANVLLCDAIAFPWRSGLMPWFATSGPLALALAIHLGADEVVAWGCDMAGATDFAGGTNTSRADARWVQERDTWSELCRIARDRGCNVRRIV